MTTPTTPTTDADFLAAQAARKAESAAARAVLGLSSTEKLSSVSGRRVQRGWRESGLTRSDLDAAAARLGLTIRVVQGANGRFLVIDSQDDC